MKNKKYAALLLVLLLLISHILSGCYVRDAFVYVWGTDHSRPSEAAGETQAPEETKPQETVSEITDHTEVHSPLSAYSDQGFLAYTDELFGYFLKDSTMNVHYFIGDGEPYHLDPYKAVFPSYSKAQEEESTYKEELDAYRKRLQSFDYSQLGWEEQFMYDVLEEFFRTEEQSIGFSLYTEPLSASNGVQSSLPVEFAEYTFYTEEDVKTYLELMQLVPAYFKDILVFEQQKADAGLFMEDKVLSEVIDQCKKFADGKAEDGFLYVTFEERLKKLGLSEEAEQKYMAENRAAVDTFYGAYDLLLKKLPGFMGKGTVEGGLCNLPDGKKYYEYLVRSHTGTDKTPSELIAAFDRAISEGMEELNAAYRRQPFIYDMMDSYSFPAKDPSLIMRMHIASTEKDFPALYDVDYAINYVDPSLRDYLSPAFYLVTPFDRDVVNNIYINAQRGSEDDDIYTGLAHEGYPGHLYQSNFLRQNSAMALRSILSTSGFSEGYGEYVEHLSYYFPEDMEKELADFMVLNDRITLYIYSRVDLGIHYEGWTEKDIEKFISSYFSEPKDVARWMYTHILGDPGGYLDYVVGEMEILELKETAKTADNYSELEFHTALLSLSGAPFYIIRKWMFE